MRLAHHLGEQAVCRLGQRGGVYVVVLWNDEHMNGRLRIDITERQRPVAFQHPLSRQLTSANLAKHAIGHPMIVAVVPAGAEPAPCASVALWSEAATARVSDPVFFRPSWRTA